MARYPLVPRLSLSSAIDTSLIASLDRRAGHIAYSVHSESAAVKAE